MQEKIKKLKTYGRIKRVQNNDNQIIATCSVSIKGFLLALLGLTTKCKTSMVLDNLIKKQ